MHEYHVQAANPALFWIDVWLNTCTLIALHQRGLMALQRYCEWYYKKKEDTAKFGAVAILVHWPRENVNIYILIQRVTLISCVQQFTAKMLTLGVFCRTLWDKSLQDTLHFFCWYHHSKVLLPICRRGEFYFLARLWWFEVVLVLFLTVGISPVAHPQPWNFPIKINTS